MNSGGLRLDLSHMKLQNQWSPLIYPVIWGNILRCLEELLRKMSTGIDKKSGKEMAARAWPLTPSPPGQQRLIMFRELQKDEGALRTGTLHSPKVLCLLCLFPQLGQSCVGGKWASQKHRGERVMTPICGRYGALLKPAISVLMQWWPLSLHPKII